jgi:hypothetical protein
VVIFAWPHLLINLCLPRLYPFLMQESSDSGDTDSGSDLDPDADPCAGMSQTEVDGVVSVLFRPAHIFAALDHMAAQGHLLRSRVADLPPQRAGLYQAEDLERA